MVILENLQKPENWNESIGGALHEEGIVEDRSYGNMGGGRDGGGYLEWVSLSQGGGGGV